VPIASAGVSKGKSLGNALLKSVLVIDFVLICDVYRTDSWCKLLQNINYCHFRHFVSTAAFYTSIVCFPADENVSENYSWIKVLDVVQNRLKLGVKVSRR